MTTTNVLTTDTAGWRRQDSSTGWGRVTVSYHLEGCHHVKAEATALDPGEVVQDGFVTVDSSRWQHQQIQYRICKRCARRWAQRHGPAEVELVAKLFPVAHREPLDPQLAEFLGHWSRRPMG